MRHFVISAVLGSILAAALHAQPALPDEQSQLDADLRMFTVMTAINVAGYDDGVGSRTDSLIRQAVREQLRDFDGESKKLLLNAYERYKLSDPSENLSQFVTYALICSPAPFFELEADLPTDLPPEVRRLRPLGRILQQFFEEAEIESLWEKYQPAFEQELERYQQALVPMLFRSIGYLRLATNGREFQGFRVWIDQMGAPNAVNTRLYGGNMQVVVHPTDQIPLDEIRHAFLIHLLDRLSIRYRPAVAEKEALSRFALFAPALDGVYKEDFELLVTKCLVKAVEQRLDRSSEAEKLAAVDQALKEGYILTPYFFHKLAEFETDGRDINRYYEDMVKAIDLKAEAARLQGVQFVEKAAEPDRAQPIKVQLSPLDKKLQQAEFLLREDMLDEARAAFVEALNLAEGRSAQANYGLARVAITQADPDVAREHFIDAAAMAEDPHLKAMSHIYIGRIEDVVGNRERAIEQYRLALEAGDPSERTKQLAERGLAAPFARPGSEQQQP